MPPDDIRAIKAYIEANHQSSAPFDIIATEHSYRAALQELLENFYAEENLYPY